MQESFPLEHGSELVADASEQLLNGGRVAQESDGHLETTRGNVTLSGQHVVGDPLDEVSRVLVLDVLHLLLDLLHGNLTTEDSSNSEIATVSWVRCGHHVLSVEHLLRQLWDSNGTVLLAPTGSQWSKAGKEEVQTRERNWRQKLVVVKGICKKTKNYPC